VTVIARAAIARCVSLRIESVIAEHLGDVLVKMGKVQDAKAYYEMAYNDHHIFSIDDLKEIKKRFDTISAGKKIIITTEKDAVRLVKFDQELADMPLYVVPIELEFLFNDAGRFNGLIGTFIKDFGKKM